MCKLGMDILKQVVKENNTNKKVINDVANVFLNRGFNKALAKRIFTNSERLKELSQVELICFCEALYSATKNNQIKLEKIFTQEELSEYNEKRNGKNIEYLPKNHEELGERELLKLEFLNKKYGNRNTKQHYYYLYLAHIKDEEDFFQRDLCEFTLYDIIDTMQGVIGSISTRNNTLSFITKYLDYCVEVGIINENVLNHATKEEMAMLVDKGQEAMENNYISFNELESELSWLEGEEDNTIQPMDVMIALLLRCGISNKEIVALKNSDFDFDKKMVTIRGEGKIQKKKLPNEVFHWVEVSKNSSGIIPKTRFVLKTLDDHIIKLNSEEYDEKQALASIKRRMAKFKEFGFRPLNENLLITCKKIDMLDDIVSRKGELRTEDFQDIQTRFGNSKASYFKLKTEYEMIRGNEHIALGRKNSK